MAQTGYTPLLIYASGTATNVPLAANLTSSASGAELALNYADGKLFYKDSGGTVQVLAVKMPSGILPIANGGTNATATPTAGAVAYGTGTAYAFSSAGSSGQVLVSGGTSSPTWSSLSSIGVTTFSAGTTGFTPSSATSGAITLAGTLATTNGGTGLTSFTANGVLYASSSSALTTGSALTYDGNTFKNDTASTTAANIRIENGSFNRVGSFALTANGVQFDAFDQNSTSAQRSYMWLSGGSEQMRLTSTGLGIGTSSPGQKLDVNGQATILQGTSYGWRITNSGGIRSGSNGVLQVSADTNNAYANSAILFDIDGSVFATLDSSGNLGLGVTPSAWSGYTAFQVKDAALASSGSAEAILSANAFYGSGGWTYRQTAASARYALDSQHRWFTAPSGTAGNAITFTQAMTLDASGNLLVGTTSTGYTDSNGFYYSPTSSNGYFICNHTTSMAGGSRYIGFGYGANNEIGVISQNGTTGVSYNTSSDYRLKDNPQPLTGSGAFIDALKPKTWEWKADGSKGVGFIAHEVQEVSPSSVMGEKDGEQMQAMEYGSAEFIANIIAELQSLRKRVAQLEGK
jgi:hypothetical protein